VPVLKLQACPFQLDLLLQHPLHLLMLLLLSLAACLHLPAQHQCLLLWCPLLLLLLLPPAPLQQQLLLLLVLAGRLRLQALLLPCLLLLLSVHLQPQTPCLLLLAWAAVRGPGRLFAS
jgi:hypothetical protein